MFLGQSDRPSMQSVLDFLFPAACPFCFDHCDAPTRTSIPLCKECRSRLIPRPLLLCQGCGALLGPYVRPSQQCVYCFRDRFAFSRAWSLGTFHGDLRIAVLRAKSQRGELLSKALADLLYEIHGEEWSTEPPDVVIGVPHHWTSRWSMWHQASQTAARRLALRLGCPFENRAVLKLSRTKRQATLSSTARRANLRGVFQVRGKSRLSGKRILLVDDVLTTGTTAHRIAALLKRDAGAEDVQVCVFARGVGQT